MRNNMRNLVAAAYYLALFSIVAYIFGNIAGMDLIASMQNAVNSAIGFLQQLSSWLSIYYTFG